MGMGTDQPFEPGSPAPVEHQAYTPPAPTPVREEPSKETPDDNEPDAPVIKKPTITKPDATKIHEKDVVKSKPVTKPHVETPPAPVVVKPKAVFKGVNGNGTGGNEADTYKKGGNQGIAGGQGDQGRPGGNPNSDNYTGGGKGNGSIQVTKGNRSIVSGQNFSFKGDFDRNAVVYAEIRVDQNGHGEFVRVGKGSTTTDQAYVDDIRQKLRSIKFTTGADDDVITVKFNFKVTQ
jgi:hypothetical protein